MEQLARLRPLRFFGSIGAACSVLGTVMLSICIYQKLVGAHESLYGRPLFLTSISLVVQGIQVIGLGLLLEIIARFADWWRDSDSE